MILKPYGLSVLDLDLTKFRDAPISHNLHQIPSLQEWYLVQIMRNWCISEFRLYIILSNYVFALWARFFDCFNSYVGVKQGELCHHCFSFYFLMM